MGNEISKDKIKTHRHREYINHLKFEQAHRVYRDKVLELYGKENKPMKFQIGDQVTIDNLDPFTNSVYISDIMHVLMKEGKVGIVTGLSHRVSVVFPDRSEHVWWFEEEWLKLYKPAGIVRAIPVDISFTPEHEEKEESLSGEDLMESIRKAAGRVR
jgi:hypothetical protein